MNIDKIRELYVRQQVYPYQMVADFHNKCENYKGSSFVLRMGTIIILLALAIGSMASFIVAISTLGLPTGVLTAFAAGMISSCIGQLAGFYLHLW